MFGREEVTTPVSQIDKLWWALSAVLADYVE